MLYFACGSNLDFARLRHRCPGARFRCKAVLPDHELQLNRWSKSLQSGVADIEPAPDKAVWGVVFHLERSDRLSLNKSEGVPLGAYRPKNVWVQVDGDSARSLEVFTYVVCVRESPRPKPSQRYLRYLLGGASHWGLPQAYIDQLRRVETHYGEGKK